LPQLIELLRREHGDPLLDLMGEVHPIHRLLPGRPVE
jgi:hypothetical protein